MDKQKLMVIGSVAVLILAGIIIFAQSRRNSVSPPHPEMLTPLGAAVAKFEDVFGPSFVTPPGGTKLDDARRYAQTFCNAEYLQTDDQTLTRLFTAAAEVGEKSPIIDQSGRDAAMAQAAKLIKSGPPAQ